MIDIPDSIFPTNDSGEKICPKCQNTLDNCSCEVKEEKKPASKKQKIKPVIRIEKSGRKGKIVTLIERLPNDEEYLNSLAKKLKTQTGTGGTFYIKDTIGIIELQGDKRKTLEDSLLKWL